MNRKLKGRTKHVGFRMTVKDIELFNRIAKSRGEDMSDFVRRAIRTEFARLSYLPEEEKKALGVQSDKMQEVISNE